MTCRRTITVRTLLDMSDSATYCNTQGSRDGRDLAGWVNAELSRLTARHEPPWRDAAPDSEGGRTVTGNEPLERDKDGYRINKHGLSGYARGCRCDVCERRED